MFLTLPMLLAFVFCAGATTTCLYLGRFAFDYSQDQHPYKDTGFLASPNWSDVMYPNYIVATFHGILVLFLVFAHTSRHVLLRRLLFLWGLTQLIQTLQNCVTRLPDPNERLRDRTWHYTMYPVQYMVGASFFHFYCAHKVFNVFAWVVSIFGMMLLIPTHAFYTVGVLSGAFAGTLPVFLYHWYVRTSTSISKRAVLRWFEKDALNITPVMEGSGLQTMLFGNRSESFVIPSPNRGAPPPKKPLPNAYGGHDDPAEQPPTIGSPSSPLDEDTAATRDHDTGFMYMSREDPRSDFVMEHYRYPTFVGDEYSRCVEENVAWVNETFTEKQKFWYPPLIAFLTICFAGGAMFSNLGAVHISDANRPIGIPLPDDLLYPILPELPDHTADVMLYIQLGLVFIFVLCQKKRFVIIRRVALPFGIIMWLRSITVPATFLPDPSPVCAHREHAPGTTCGDLIFSGHTIAFLMSALVVHRYVAPIWIEAAVWTYTWCGLLAVVASRLHYTRDVITAILVGTTIDHLVNVAIYSRPDRMLSHKWLRYFESDYFLYLLAVRAEEEENPGHRHSLVKGETLATMPMSQGSSATNRSGSLNSHSYGTATTSLHTALSAAEDDYQDAA